MLNRSGAPSQLETRAGKPASKTGVGTTSRFLCSNAGLGGCEYNPIPPGGTANAASRNNAGLKGCKRNLIPPRGPANNASRDHADLKGCNRNPIPPGETADTASQNDAGLNGCELAFTRYSFSPKLSCTSQSYLYIAPSIYIAHAIAIPLHDCKRNPIPPRGQHTRRHETTQAWGAVSVT